MALSRTVCPRVPSGRFRPTLECLEDRCTPADVLGAVRFGVLHLTAVQAASAEGLQIMPKPDGHPGAFTVGGLSGTTINGAALHDFFGVRSIIIRLKGGNDGANLVGIRLPGGLTFLGGDGANGLDLRNNSRIGGSIRVVNGTNAPGSFDLVRIREQAQIGGSVMVSNGAGGSDTQVFSNVRIAGSLQLTGGPDVDLFTLDDNTVLGAGLAADLGGGLNATKLLECILTRSVRVTGGGGSYNLTVVNAVLGASLSADLGSGANMTRFNDSSVARSVKVTGGAGTDGVDLTDTWVGRHLTTLLGGNFNLLTIDDAGVDISNSGSTINGALTYVGGNGQDNVQLGFERPVTLVGPVWFTTGNGSDTLSNDDVFFLNTVLIETGAGDDFLLIERRTTPAFTQTHLAAKASIRTGVDNDKVLLGAASSTGLKVLFAGKPAVDGGPGSADTLFRENYASNGVNQAPFPAPGFENVFS